LQVARAAGITTVATASPRNFELVKVRAVEDSEENFVGIVDCISEEDTSLKHCISVLENLGGGKLGIEKPEKELDLSANIEVCRIFAFDESTDPFWKDFLTPTHFEPFYSTRLFVLAACCR
jgi:hypothetical protein